MVARLLPRVQARRKSRHQRHCAGSSRGRQRSGVSRPSSQAGSLGSTAGSASGATKL
ncbi:hypothetical protein WJ971_01400 [Achromobacter xylosoxidans]